MASGIVAIIVVGTAPTPDEGSLRARPDAPDALGAELERAFRDRSTSESIDLDQQPVPQSASRSIVSACSPWIRATTINGPGWG